MKVLTEHDAAIVLIYELLRTRLPLEDVRMVLEQVSSHEHEGGYLLDDDELAELAVALRESWL